MAKLSSVFLILIFLGSFFIETKISTLPLNNIKIENNTKINTEYLYPIYKKIDGKIKWAYINKMGKIIIEPTFEYAKHFSDGMAGIKLNNKWGFINEKGDIVIKPQFDWMHNFSDGLASVNIGGYIDKREIDKGKAGITGGKWWFINKNGDYVIELKDVRSYEFKEGLANAKIWVDNDYKYGFINKNGEIVIPMKFDYAREFSEGMAVVEINDKWGYIDKKGNFIIEPIFDRGYNFSDGLAVVKIGKKWGYIDKMGKFIMKFDDIKLDFNSHFSNGLAIAKIKKNKYNYKWGYIDKKGNFIIEPNFGYVEPFIKEIAIVMLGDFINEKWGIINKQGNYIVKPKFKEIKYFYGNLLKVRFPDNKWGYIDKTGKIIWMSE